MRLARLVAVLAGASGALLVLPAPSGTAAGSVPVGPGVELRTVVRGDATAYVLRVDLPATSTPAAVLAAGRLAGVETTSSMAARTGAVAAVNGDFALSSGRPVHAFAAAGQLAQTHQLPGRGVGIDRAGDAVRLGAARVGVTVARPGGPVLRVPRWNSGPPTGDALAGFTGAGAGLEAPPGGACYAVLTPKAPPQVGDTGRTTRPMQVRRRTCSATPPPVPAGGGAVLVARPGSRAAEGLRSLRVGGTATMSQALGFPRSWSLVGGSEALVVDGRVFAADVDRPGDYVQGPQPRTAVGVTGDRRLLLVVVDGRQPGHSTGMSLRQLAHLMVDLGARGAVNLDGGGSSTMWAQGRVVNRPSDGRERGVSSALVVLPGAPGAALSATVGVPGAPPAWQLAATDPGSTGGLADALRRGGAPLEGDLAQAAAGVGR